MISALLGSVYTYFLFRVGAGGLTAWWEWAAFVILCYLVGVYVRDLLRAIAGKPIAGTPKGES